MPKAQANRRSSSHAVRAVGTAPLCSAEYEERLYNVLKSIQTGDIELPVAPRPSKAGAGQPKRPCNSFIIFRSGYGYLKAQQGEDAKDSQVKTKKVAQQDVSRESSVLWKSFPLDSRVYILCNDMSKGLQEEHNKAYPDYRYTPHSKRDKTNSGAVSVRPRRKSGNKIRRRTPRYESDSDAESTESSDSEEWHPKPKIARGTTLRLVASADSVSNRISRRSPASPRSLPESSSDAQSFGTPSLVSNTDTPSAWSSIQLPETPGTSTHSLPPQSPLTYPSFAPDALSQTMQSGHFEDEQAELPILDDRSLSHEDQLAQIYDCTFKDAFWMYSSIYSTGNSSQSMPLSSRQSSQPPPQLEAHSQTASQSPFAGLSYDAASLPLPLPNIWDPSHPCNLSHRLSSLAMDADNSPMLPQMAPASGAYEDPTLDLDFLTEVMDI